MFAEELLEHVGPAGPLRVGVVEVEDACGLVGFLRCVHISDRSRVAFHAIGGALCLLLGDRLLAALQGG